MQHRPQTNSSTVTNTYLASFFGKPNNGVIEIPIGSTGTSNLIGNPYPSAIDADTFLAENATIIDGTILFWTHNTAIQLASQISNPGSGTYAYTSDDYASYNSSGGVVTHLGEIAPSGKIASGVSFMTTSKTNNSKVLFNNKMRLNGGSLGINNSQFFKMSSIKTKKVNVIEKNRIWLNLTNTQGSFKQTLVGYITGATNGIDNAFDGESYDGNEYIDFYSINSNKNLVIQGRALPFDKNDEVPLGFRTTIDGVFSINIDHTDGFLRNQSVFIEDKLMNTITDLKNGNYTFTTAVGIFNNRFVLSYANKSLGTKDFNIQKKSVLVSSKDKQINIISQVERIDKVFVYDVLGRCIYQKNNVDNNELIILDLGLSHNTIFVKTVLQNNKVVTTKIIY